VPQPAYGRVASAIESKILDRSLRPGDLLPTENDLALQFGVNRSTVREALRRSRARASLGATAAPSGCVSRGRASRTPPRESAVRSRSRT